jgi:hypothetical protein
MVARSDSSLRRDPSALMANLLNEPRPLGTPNMMRRVRHILSVDLNSKIDQMERSICFPHKFFQFSPDSPRADRLVGDSDWQ